MTFKKYNHTNNAFCELLTDLQSSDRTMMLQGNYNRLPTSNFIVKISKYQGTKCVARENIYVANRNNNICTGLVRAYEKVPMDDDATEWIQQALNFSAGDMVECVVSSEVINDLRNGIEDIRKIPDIRWQNRKPSEYTSSTFYWPEFVERQTVGVEWTWWVNLMTFACWKTSEPTYITQMAISSNGWTGIWIRNAVDANTWDEWQKVFPFSATGIDVTSLPEAQPTGRNGLDLLVLRTHHWSNHKITIHNFKTWLFSNLSGSAIALPKAINITSYPFEYTSSSTSIPKWWICHAVAWSPSGWAEWHATTIIQWSANNSTWNDVISLYRYQSSSVVLKPWFVRINSRYMTQNSEFATIQHFV